VRRSALSKGINVDSVMPEGQVRRYNLILLSTKGGGPQSSDDLFETRGAIPLDPSAGCPTTTPGHGGHHWHSNVQDSRADAVSVPPPGQPLPFTSMTDGRDD